MDNINNNVSGETKKSKILQNIENLKNPISTKSIQFKVQTKNGSLTDLTFRNHDITAIIDETLDTMEGFKSINFTNELGNKIYIKKDNDGLYLYNDLTTVYKGLDQTEVINPLFIEEIRIAVNRLKDFNLIDNFEIKNKNIEDVVHLDKFEIEISKDGKTITKSIEEINKINESAYLNAKDAFQILKKLIKE